MPISEETPIENSKMLEIEIGNWPSYDYPLACRMMKKSDAWPLFPVMKRSAKKLKGYIEWAKYSPSWDFKTVQKFVDDHVDSEWPRFHLIFSIGKQIVAQGSLAPMPNPRDIQVALWVALGHERRGIGQWVVTVLEWYAFNVFGYDNVYYQHDARNRASGSLPQKMDYRWSHSFDQEIHASSESGLWYSWVKERPAGLPKGAIDTGDMDRWQEIRFPWVSMI